jgi:hypothetical protein
MLIYSMGHFVGIMNNESYRFNNWPQQCIYKIGEIAVNSKVVARFKIVTV